MAIDEELEMLAAYWQDEKPNEFERDLNVSIRKNSIVIVMRSGNRLSERYECVRKDRLWVLTGMGGRLISTFYGLWDEKPTAYLVCQVVDVVYKEEELRMKKMIGE